MAVPTPQLLLDVEEACIRALSEIRRVENNTSFMTSPVLPGTHHCATVGGLSVRVPPSTVRRADRYHPEDGGGTV